VRGDKLIGTSVQQLQSIPEDKSTMASSTSQCRSNRREGFDRF
jgi:hypothetical protein